MEHGIEIWTNEGWVFVVAENREEADRLHAVTVARKHWLSRRVARTDEGHVVLIHATA